MAITPGRGDGKADLVAVCVGCNVGTGEGVELGAGNTVMMAVGTLVEGGDGRKNSTPIKSRVRITPAVPTTIKAISRRKKGLK
jgi:hypothetical protein